MRREYPNPQQKRELWQPLNGEWEFCFGEDLPDKVNLNGTGTLPLKIRVPFAYQTPASGICDKTDHEYMWYKKHFYLSEDLKNAERVVLRFLAVDNECEVYANGKFACYHKGGYEAFEVDITRFLVDGEQTLAIKVRDAKSAYQPRGKQTYRETPFECWYYPTSGIWQSVWLEGNYGDRVVDLRFSPDYETGEVTVRVETDANLAKAVEIEVVTPTGEIIKERAEVKNKKATVKKIFTKSGKPNEDERWSPESPVLFTANLKLLSDEEKTLDEIKSYFAYRKVSVGGDKILLNDQPITLKMLLDQGYWEESGMTPPSDKALLDDITLAKAMGFNGARKHQKVEDPYFYYYADLYGFIVWAETPSGYEFCPEEVREITRLQTEVIRKAYNHPCVIAYVPFNESWGVPELLADEKQKSFVRSVYHLTKALDDTRLCMTNDGWENLSESDLITIHDYSARGDDFKQKYEVLTEDCIPQLSRRLMARGEKIGNQPVMLTEYGGISVRGANGWGYGAEEKDEDAFMERFRTLYRRANERNFCGVCYTQLSDCEQEVNGLLDARHKPKYSPEKIKAIMDEFN